MSLETTAENIFSNQEPRGHRLGGVAGGADFGGSHDKINKLAEQDILNRDFATRVIDNLAQQSNSAVTLEVHKANAHLEPSRLPIKMSLVGQVVEQIAFGITGLGGGMAIGNAFKAFQNGDNNTAAKLGIIGIVALGVFADLLKDSRQRGL